MKVLLTGTTGEVGQALLGALSAYSMDVRILARDPDKVAVPEGSSCEVVAGDFLDRASLDSALQGIEKAFMLLGNVPEQANAENQFVDAAKANGVKHLVKMSAIGADAESSVEFKRCHGETEAHIEASGIPYTNVQPNFFMQNFLHIAAAIQHANVIPMPMGDGAVGTIDTRDVADFVLQVLSGDQHKNATYEISGPEVLTFAELAKEMTAQLGREIEYVGFDVEGFKTQMKEMGLSQWYVDSLADLFAEIAEGESAKTNDTFEQVMGRKPQTFTSFVNEHRNHFTLS